MPNQHAATIPVSELTTDQGVKHLIRTVIPQMEGTIIMALNAALERLGNEVTTQLQQTADALARVQEAVDAAAVSDAEKADLQAALDEAVATNQSATEAINAQADALAADNPVEEPEEPVDPTEPGGGDPSPSDPSEPTP